MEFTTTSKDWIIELVTAWDIGAIQAVVEIHPGKVYKVECVTGTPLILKNIGKDSPQITTRFEFEYDVLSHLDRGGISIALPIPSREGNFLVMRDGQLYTLSPYLTTNNRWLELDFEGLKRLNSSCGAAIAELHVVLAAFPTESLENRTWKTVLPDNLFDHCIPTIQQNITQQERDNFDTILIDIATDLQATIKNLPMQLIHRDCHHGNIVVDGERVSGFVDCDHLSIGPRIFDLADFIVHMIKQYVTDQERTSEWFDLFPTVIQGYERVTSLQKEERQALYYVMLGILLMLAQWFFEKGQPARAQLELDAFTWMYHYRQKIRDRIMKTQEASI